LINIAPTHAQTTKLLSWRVPAEQAQIQQLWTAGERQVSAQDRQLYSLLTPDRLLNLIYGYIIFDNGTKKIARYQTPFYI
jgi:type I restriction enzyme, R subunit